MPAHVQAALVDWKSIAVVLIAVDHPKQEGRNRVTLYNIEMLQNG